MSVEITAEMVMQVCPYRYRNIAEQAARYATLRIGGSRWVDAAREVGVSDKTARRYESLIPLLRDRFDLPEPPPIRSSVRRPAEWGAVGGTRGAHQRRHVQRGITNPDCPHCQTSPSASSQVEGDRPPVVEQGPVGGPPAPTGEAAAGIPGGVVPAAATKPERSGS
jgi:hypothetical protein